MFEGFSSERSFIGARDSSGNEYVCAVDSVCDSRHVTDEELKNCCCKVETPSVWYQRS